MRIAEAVVGGLELLISRIVSLDDLLKLKSPLNTRQERGGIKVFEGIVKYVDPPESSIYQDEISALMEESRLYSSTVCVGCIATSFKITDE